jgi:hypothetical protein
MIYSDKYTQNGLKIPVEILDLGIYLSTIQDRE